MTTEQETDELQQLLLVPSDKEVPNPTDRSTSTEIITQIPEDPAAASSAATAGDWVLV